ncbi:MAG TPA: S-layer homology domain-containing protein, partial [Anaerovoracaceae bacterium]|nr:S-layer homology domain-containing protein [Anaerovoracaceae bacterium]
ANVGDIAHIEGINLYVEEISTYLYTEEGVDRADEEPNDIYIGGIAGLHLAVRTIEDCNVTFQDNIYASNESGDVIIGGITAVNAGSVSDCKTYTNQSNDEENCIYVRANGGEAYVGGIAGYNVGNIKHSDHEGTLCVTTEDNRKVYIDESFTENVYLGGIVGYADASVFSDNIVIEDCQNNGDITCLNSYDLEESRACAGGIAGYIYQGNDEVLSGKVLEETDRDGNPYVCILNCANIGEYEVYSKAQSAISGGIAGASRFTPGAISVIEDCYNQSMVVSEMTETYKKEETNAGGLCIGAASGGIVGATGGIGVLSSYSTGKVYADAYTNAITISKYVEGYAGGIAGLIWNTDFTQNYYLPNETVDRGVGGAVVLISDQVKTDTLAPEESMPYEIQTIADPEGVTSASALNLQTKAFFGDQWRWYSSGGTPDNFYDSENPWRYTTVNGYPVLRGAMYTPPATPPSGGGGGGSSKKAVTTTPAALNKVDHFAYVVGYPDGEVKPLGTITKEEVAVIFYRLMTEESRKAYSSTVQPFTDVSSDRWSSNEIATLYNAKIIQGSLDGKFMPAKPITRAEFAAIAAKFDKLEKTQENKFSDISNHWAKDFINSSAEKGWISGYEDGTFRPDNSIIRCEAMKLINEVLDRRVDVAGLHKESRQWPDNTQDKWYYEIVLEATNTHDYERADKPKSIEKWTKIKNDPVW